MDKIISEIVTSVGRYFVILGYFFDEIATYNLIFRDRYFKIIKDESYKYTFFIYTITSFYFTITYLIKIDFSPEIFSGLKSYLMNFDTGKPFVFTCVYFLLLINLVAYFLTTKNWKRKIIRRFAIYIFSAQQIFILIIIFIAGLLNYFQGYLKDSIIKTILGPIIGIPIIYTLLIQLPFVQPFKVIKIAFSNNDIDKKMAIILRFFVFLPVIFLILIISYLDFN